MGLWLKYLIQFSISIFQRSSATRREMQLYPNGKQKISNCFRIIAKSNEKGCTLYRIFFLENCGLITPFTHSAPRKWVDFYDILQGDNILLKIWIMKMEKKNDRGLFVSSRGLDPCVCQDHHKFLGWGAYWCCHSFWCRCCSQP